MSLFNMRHSLTMQSDYVQTKADHPVINAQYSRRPRKTIHSVFCKVCYFFNIYRFCFLIILKHKMNSNKWSYIYPHTHAILRLYQST